MASQPERAFGFGLRHRDGCELARDASEDVGEIEARLTVKRANARAAGRDFLAHAHIRKTRLQERAGRLADLLGRRAGLGPFRAHHRKVQHHRSLVELGRVRNKPLDRAVYADNRSVIGAGQHRHRVHTVKVVRRELADRIGADQPAPNTGRHRLIDRALDRVLLRERRGVVEIQRRAITRSAQDRDRSHHRARQVAGVLTDPGGRDHGQMPDDQRADMDRLIARGSWRGCEFIAEEEVRQVIESFETRGGFGRTTGWSFRAHRDLLKDSSGSAAG